jgi:hypothetical protein
MSFPAGVKPFAERQFPQTICMFDVDGTLSPARLSASPEMLETLKKLREKCAIAFVGGSDLKKIAEQLCPDGGNGECRLLRARKKLEDGKRAVPRSSVLSCSAWDPGHSDGRAAPTSRVPTRRPASCADTFDIPYQLVDKAKL